MLTLLPPAMYKLLIALLVLVVVALFLVAGLLFLRQRRRNSIATSTLPMYDEKRASTSSTSSHHRRGRHARPSHSIHIYHDKPSSDRESSRPSTPGSPVPEIRITFPEEFDEEGKRQSGRVVVVHVGETGIGMEPLKDEKLPAYQVETRDMQSVDLERVGGLEEKPRKPLGW